MTSADTVSQEKEFHQRAQAADRGTLMQSAKFWKAVEEGLQVGGVRIWEL